MQLADHGFILAVQQGQPQQLLFAALEEEMGRAIKKQRGQVAAVPRLRPAAANQKRPVFGRRQKFGMRGIKRGIVVFDGSPGGEAPVALVLGDDLLKHFIEQITAMKKQ